MRAILLVSLFAILPATLFAQDNQGVVNSIQGTVTDPGTGWSKWSVSYFNFTVAGMEQVNKGGASWNIYQYLSLNYKLSSESKIALRPSFTTQTAGIYNQFENSRPLQTRGDDFHIDYSNYSLANFPGEWDLSGTFYFYAPTSENSQTKRWVTRVKSWMILEKKINRDWTVTYNMKPEYFFNTQKAYRKETSDSRPDGTSFTQTRAENNQLGAYDHYLEVSRYANKYFTPQLAVGFKHEWNEDSNEADSKPLVNDSFKISPSTWVFVNRQLKFIVGVENSINIRSPNKEFALFREEDNSYYVMTFWNIL